MASTPPTDGTPAAPKAAPASVVKTDASVARPADARPAESEPKPVGTVQAVAEKVVETLAKPIAAVIKPAPVSATAATPSAKKKAVAKPARPKVARRTVETIKPPAAAAIAKAPAVVTKEANIMEAQIKNAAEKAKMLFTDANAKSGKALGDVNDFAKGNIEALVESGKIAAKGLESIGQDNAEFTRKQFESATAALKTLSTVKSPTDFFKLQGDYMRTYFDSLVAHGSQSTEKMLKLAGDVAQPIQNRVSVAVEKVKIAA